MEQPNVNETAAAPVEPTTPFTVHLDADDMKLYREAIRECREFANTVPGTAEKMAASGSSCEDGKYLGVVIANGLHVLAVTRSLSSLAAKIGR